MKRKVKADNYVPEYQCKQCGRKLHSKYALKNHVCRIKEHSGYAGATHERA